MEEFGKVSYESVNVTDEDCRNRALKEMMETDDAEKAKLWAETYSTLVEAKQKEEDSTQKEETLVEQRKDRRSKLIGTIVASVCVTGFSLFGLIFDAGKISSSPTVRRLTDKVYNLFRLN